MSFLLVTDNIKYKKWEQMQFDINWNSSIFFFLKCILILLIFSKIAYFFMLLLINHTCIVKNHTFRLICEECPYWYK